MMTHTDSYQTQHGNGFVLGLLAGVAAGGALALLFAPRPGADTRHDLADGMHRAGRRLRDAYDSAATTARRGAERVRHEASRAIDRASDSAHGMASDARDDVKDAARSLHKTIDEAATKSTGGIGNGPVATSRPPAFR